VPADLAVHGILDNASTHKTAAVHRWLLRHRRLVFHFTPTSSSWLNLVERWFAELTTQAATLRPPVHPATHRRPPVVPRREEAGSAPLQAHRARDYLGKGREGPQRRPV